MATIITLRNEVEAIINEQLTDVDYFRGTFTEANLWIEGYDLENCMAINLHQGQATGTRSGNHITKLIPIELLFLYKNTALDDRLSQSDLLISWAEDKADEFYDLLIQSSVISDLIEFEDYEINALEAYKRFDAITTGVLFTWNAPVSRSQYYCNGVTN